MSFDPKRKAHKASLYKALTAAAELANEPFDQFLQTPFDPPWNLAANYRRNLQRGEYSAIRAKVLYEFMIANHFTVAHSEALEIFPQTPEMRWQEIIDRRAIEGKLSIVPVKRSMGIVQRASKVDAVGTTLKLGQEFCLKLDSDLGGHAIALQGVRSSWHPIPLAEDQSFVATIKTASNTLPLGSNGDPEPLVENHDLGLHQFVVVVAKTPDVPRSLTQLVSWVEESCTEIHVAKVRLVE